MGRSVTLFVGVLLVACSSPTDVSFVIEPTTQGIVVATARDDVVTVEAIDPEAEAAWRTKYIGESAAEIVVLQYDDAFDALDLTPGPVLRVTDAAIPSQLLPDADRMDLRIVAAADAGAWNQITALPIAIQGFRFKRTTAQACLEGGGCYVSIQEEDGISKRCRTPCPTPDPPEPPLPPEAPRITCPEGWSLTDPDGPDDIAVCAAYPTGLSTRCAAGLIHLPGTAGCEPLGPGCPSGRFADGLPPNTIFVERAGTGGGTRGAPFGTIADALAAASTGDTIALSADRFSEAPMIGVDVTIVGACASATIIGDAGQLVGATITASAALENLTVHGQTALRVAGDVTLRGVDLDASRLDGLHLAATGSVRGRRVQVRTQQNGLTTEGGTIDLSEVTVVDAGNLAVNVIQAADVRLDRFAIDGSGSSAIVLGAGSTLNLQRGTVRGFSYGALQFGGAAAVTLSDVIIRDAQSEGANAGFVPVGAVVDGDRVVIENMNGSGISASGGTITLRDSVIRHIKSRPISGDFGSGLEASTGGFVRLERALIYETRGVGVLSVGPGSGVELVDVVVVETRGRRIDGERGTALNAFRESTIHVERVHVVRAHGFGIVAELSATVSGTDLRVSDTLPRDANDAYGRGAEVSEGGVLNVTRAVFERGRSVAVFGLDPNTRIDLTDVVMSGTIESRCFMFSCNVGLADGITVILSAQATIERFEIIDNKQYGVRISNDPQLTLRNGRIANNAVAIQSVSPDFDIARIADGVLLENNDVQFSIFDE